MKPFFKLHKTIILINLIVITFLTSCEKEIQVDLPDYQSKIVIEGSIETNQPEIVCVTRSTDYFQKYDSATISHMIVTNAVVTVTNQFGITDTLVPVFDMSQPLPFIYKGSSVIGQVGGSYTLKVLLDGKTYSANTTILSPIAIDTMYYVEQNDREHIGIVRMKFTDPLGLRNYYRFYSKILGKDVDFIPVWGGATYDDKLFDGLSTFGDIYKGDKTNLMKDTATGEGRMNSHLFAIGDTVVVKMSSIDYYTFKFWYSAEMEMNSGGNPFTTPSPIISNIPDALGVWAGYGPAFDTIIISNPLKKQI
jgi:hypothetical protein